LRIKDRPGENAFGFERAHLRKNRQTSKPKICAPLAKCGAVDCPQLIQRLEELGYDGTVIIEAVTPEPRRDNEIRSDKAYLSRLIVLG
jgi:sugar phosphate isomerase/epimerase